jgi:hypothetical protein
MRTSQLVFAFGFMVIFGGIQSPLAQVPARAAFEVASVKPNKSNTAPSTIRLA